MDNERLTWSEKRTLAVESGLQLIPHVGGALSTAYFGMKQEKRLKRLESFYKEFSIYIESHKDQLIDSKVHDEEALTALIEKLNDKIEEEILFEKRAYFKHFFKNSLTSPTTTQNFDRRKYFLDVLGDLSLFDIHLLAKLYKQRIVARVDSIKKPGLEQSYIVGRVGRLTNFGIINAYQNQIIIGNNSQNALNESIELNDFGRAFVLFCLLTE